MRLNEVDYDGRRPVDGYGPGFFRIDGRVYRGSVAVLPEGPRMWGGYDDTATLLAVAEQVDVLLIGTGVEIAPLPRAFRQLLEDAGLGLEIMATGAACRTYNVLLGEGRRIGAALLAV
ncbi:hypothetical protein OCGS_2268 [Oceaniovalibus guishaninsula JLT2003]|uniref:Mth938-like domain-containing protein n=1 Tax=Oceaniovalibus guishaninsula JLT2003 TaxID=1231392 RepID=K2GL98_9RHOB|nr:Mth938-like domain-containing protein [Oceaniovalibus guishaninsula]EKE43536.1 hypothetical protein OCGS_2268 [Oceaniovalibus guishaninsula JLT2003]